MAVAPGQVRQCEDGTVVGVRLASADTRPRKERRGAKDCSSARSRGRMRGERKGATAVMGCPL
jgi:hypothetical protein